MLDPFTKSKYLPEYKLILWRPSGVLDFAKASMILELARFQEKILDEPFDRFIDWSQLTDVHLNFQQVENLAIHRRLDYEGPRVKSAFFATSPVAYGIARMFAALMEPSPIDVRTFRQIEQPGEWLRVPVNVLREE